MISEYIHRSHNVTVLLYHLVFPAKYRRTIFDEAVDAELKVVCLEIEDRYQVKFLEIGTDKDHVHFLVQSVPMYSVTKLVTIIKSLTAREIFRRLQNGFMLTTKKNDDNLATCTVRGSLGDA